MQIKYNAIAGYILILFLAASCHSKPKEVKAREQMSGTPVEITSISNGALTEQVELNATSSFLLKTNVKSSTTGYLQNMRIRLGDHVEKGEVIFSILTKEARSIGNTVNRIDTSFHFKGVVNIPAPGNGYITQLNYQDGDYVQDGEQIATISDDKSFAFILNIPFELTPLLKSNNSVNVELPDGSILRGNIGKPLPMVDPNSQTQGYLVQVKTPKMIPENLVAKVKLVKSTKPQAFSLPKEAILSDETQVNFWVMKLINDSTAVKMPVRKGVETHDRVEILDPVFTAADKFVVKGNYGLPDTALVRIQH